MQPIDTWALVAIVGQWLVYAGSLFAAGGVWFAVSQRPLPPVAYRSTVRSVLVAAPLAILATLLLIGVQAGRLVDDGWRGMVDPEMLALAIDGPLGMASTVRLAGLALVLTLGLFGPRAPWPALAGAAAVIGSFALSGHLGDGPWPVQLLLCIHLAAASFWLGALKPLHRLAGSGAHPIRIAATCEQFGRDAAWTVSLLVAAGVTLTWFLVGSIGALLGTAYGWTLLAKVAVVGLLLALAAANKWRFVPALAGHEPLAAAGAAAGLRRSIVIELVLFLSILLVTAVLTCVTVPPH